MALHDCKKKKWRRCSQWRNFGVAAALTLFFSIAPGVCINVVNDPDHFFANYQLEATLLDILGDINLRMDRDSFKGGTAQYCLPDNDLRRLACDLGVPEISTSCLEYSKQDRNEGVIRVMVARILGNDLPPMHGTRQTINNVKHIFHYENMPIAVTLSLTEDREYVASSLPHTWVVGSNNANTFAGTFYDPHWIPPKQCQTGLNIGQRSSRSDEERIFFSRMVVLNRIFDSETFKELTDFLNIAEFRKIPARAIRSHDYLPDWIHGAALLSIPNSGNLMRSASSPPGYATNQNRARNWSIQESLALGATWVMGLDGNIFIPQEGYKGTVKAFVEAHRRRKDYLITPYYRVATDNNHELTSLSTTKKLFTQMTLNEAQLSVRSGAPILFKHDLPYGASNKYELLRDLHRLRYARQDGGDPRWCAAADEGFDYRFSRVGDAETLNSRCGYVLRMAYWPDSGRAADSVQQPERRAHLREIALRVLCKRVAAIMESEPRSIMEPGGVQQQGYANFDGYY